MILNPSFSQQNEILFEEDDFNDLPKEIEASYLHVVMIRAYFKALKQIGIKESLDDVAKIFITYPSFSQAFSQLFTIRFHPDLDNRNSREKEILSLCQKSFGKVKDPRALQILQRFLTLLLATIRTNFYQKENPNSSPGFLSFKFDCQKINFLPKPFPLYEIFVYSPRLEACHLRMRSSKISRGGIRWSDRLQDFRYEILSLMNTQTMKNAVIVPTGSKGGFVCIQYEALQKANTSRERLQQEVMDCYQIFMQALLGLTDNFYQGHLIKPNQTVCYDDDDPYLVVAADKGTADFSDLANQIAADCNFWLGDAFASGGSKGFNHRQIGITSQGAWISVRRHFYELGIDCKIQPITVIGIGDMSGDVFGNGMLQSKSVNLIAAFNHRYIFLDPNPDLLTAYGERQRLFHLPGSSWADYDPKLISGGEESFLV